jgi:MFS family permease
MASTSVLMVGFSPIAKVIASVFECSVRTVEAQTLIFLAAFVPANFTGIHLLPKKGLKYTLVLAGVLVLIGAWLRLLVNLTGIFAIASFGSIFAAFGQTLFYQCITKLSSSWFGDKERTLSTAIGTASLPIGSIIGFTLPAKFVSEINLDDKEGGRQ